VRTTTTDTVTDYPTTERSRLRRLHERGSHGRADVHAVLDTAPLCHVGYVIDGAPYVTPTLHWREGERVYWHGSSASRFLRKALGTQVCMTCSFMDGYVLARSAFNHSVRFRSAMVFGKAQIVEGEEHKTAALRGLIENLFPGRWDTLRPMTPQELKATAILYLDIEEATAKVREGFPNDPEDAGHPVWAGAVPMTYTTVAAEPAPNLMPGIELPDYLRDLISEGRLRAPYRESADEY
jgi:nitroimidazol reductase NimA-like FMN-containing flavoprotein (pyridoxamine 5'-phosphate oxidase superfamily)